MTLLGAVAAVLLPFTGSIPGTRITARYIPNWYADLQKPWWRPPNWLFGPMWTYLYATMGYASYLVYTEGGGWEGPARLPLALYASQMLLNWTWTPLFFGLKKLRLTAIVAASMWVNILACTLAYYPVSPLAAYLMAPYLCWVTLATTLNWKIHFMNPNNGIRPKKD